MDPAEAYTASLFKWDPRTVLPQPHRLLEAISGPPPPPQHPQTVSYGIMRPGPSREMCELEDLFQAYGIRFHTATKIAELGFTKHTLLNMRDVEIDEMINSLTHHFKWELLVGEKYGIKAAIRAERKRFEDEECRKRHGISCDTTNILDALSQEGLSEDPVQQGEVVGSGGGMAWEAAAVVAARKQQRRRKSCQRKVVNMENDEEIEDDENGNERQREHPFIVTEPGEVARGKKNGLDHLFDLYEQCRAYLIQVQNIAKEHGEKCPTKVTNQVFRFAKKEGATHINKPKMRHYVHCYALHCLDEEASNALRKAYKEKGENVGAWRQACYKPLVVIASRQGWDIDAVFNAHPRLSIWYVPTKLRQLCHAERSIANAAASSSVSGGTAIDNLRF